MLKEGHVGHKCLADNQSVGERPLIEEIRELAEGLKGERVLHINDNYFGGGVAEILYTLVPLMRDVGLDAEWRIIMAEQEFYEGTKIMTNALHGDDLGLAPAPRVIY